MLRVLYLLRRLFYSVWRFLRSSGFAAKFFAISLAILTLLSLFMGSSHAAEPTGFDSIDFSYSAKAFSPQGDELITTLVKKQRGTYYGKSCTEFIIPGDFKVDGSVFMELDCFKTQSLSSDNVYNLHYEYAALDHRRVVLTACKLVFVDNAGNVLREQDIYSDPVEKYTWQTVDLNIKPNVQGLAGYQCKFVLGFMVENGQTSTSIYISERVELLNSNSNDNTTWFQRIINAIKELPEKLGSFFENLGSQISGFFSDLWNKLKVQFDNIGSWFSELGNKISGFFSDLWNKLKVQFDNIGSWFSELGNKISGFFSDLWNKLKVQFDNIGKWFSELKDSILNWFDKFKPRVYEDFAWEVGRANSSGGISKPSSNETDVCTSELFYVPYEYDTLLSVTDNMLNPDHEVYKVTIRYYVLQPDGSYFRGKNTDYIYLPTSDGDFLLPKGYYCRFELQYVTSYPDKNLSSICNSIVQVYSDEGWLTSFGHWILNGIKRLFVPPSYFWKEEFDSFKTYLKDHLGAIYQAPNILVECVKSLSSIEAGDNILVFPSKDITFTMPDGTVHTLLTANQFTLDFNQYKESSHPIAEFYNFYRTFVRVLMTSFLLWHLYFRWREIYDS